MRHKNRVHRLLSSSIILQVAEKADQVDHGVKDSMNRYCNNAICYHCKRHKSLRFLCPVGLALESLEFVYNEQCNYFFDRAQIKPMLNAIANDIKNRLRNRDRCGEGRGR